MQMPPGAPTMAGGMGDTGGGSMPPPMPMPPIPAKRKRGRKVRGHKRRIGARKRK